MISHRSLDARWHTLLAAVATVLLVAALTMKTIQHPWTAQTVHSWRTKSAGDQHGQLEQGTPSESTAHVHSSSHDAAEVAAVGTESVALTHEGSETLPNEIAIDEETTQVVPEEEDIEEEDEPEEPKPNSKKEEVSSSSKHGYDPNAHDPLDNSPYKPASDIFPAPPPGDDDEYVAICVNLKESVGPLREFLIHHYWHIGVRRFYVIDDNSSPPLSEQLGPGEWGIPDSAIEFRWLNEEELNWAQFEKYGHCIRDHADKHTWIAAVDVDELIEMRHHDPNRNRNGRIHDETLVEFLQSFEGMDHVGAVSINWLSHVGGDLIQKPVVGGFRKNFMTCLDLSEASQALTNGNKAIKSIARTAAFVDGGHVHTFILKEGYVHVDEHGAETPGKVDFWARVPVSWDRIALHHYGYLSLEQYEEKMSKGIARAGHRSYENWKEVVDGPKEPCPHLATWYP